MDGRATPYVEHGGTWRPSWIAAVVLLAALVLDVALPGPDIAALIRVAVPVVVLGIVAIGTLVARRAWTVRVDVPGPDAGAPVLGGGWSLPRGRTGLPLRLTDGRTVLVPTRDPAALRGAVVVRVADASDARGRAPGSQWTLGW